MFAVVSASINGCADWKLAHENTFKGSTLDGRLVRVCDLAAARAVLW